MFPSDENGIISGEPPIIAPKPRHQAIPAEPSFGGLTLTIIGIAILIQVMIALRLMAGSIGFDHAGSSGLDFPTAIWLGIAYVLLLFAGSVASIVAKKWIAVGIQAAIAIIMVIYFSMQ